MKKEFEKRAKMLKWFGMLMLAVIAVFAFIGNPETATGMIAAIATIPVWGSIKDNTFKELKAEEVAELSPEDQIKYINDYNEFKSNKLAEMQEDLKKSNSDEIKEAIKELKKEIKMDKADQLTILTKAVEDQGKALNVLMNEKGTKADVASVDKIVKDNLDAIKAVQEGKQKSVTLKVTRASVSDHTLAMRLSDIGQLATRRLRLRELFNWTKVPAGMNGVVRYVDQATVTRSADWKAEGAAAPDSAITWIEKTLSLEEIKDSIPVTKRSLIDVTWIANEIRRFLNKNMALKVDEDLFEGTGSTPQIKGIYTYATAITLPSTGTITAATEYDVINEAIKQVETGTEYNANITLMNPTDYNTMISQKDANNNYLLPPFARMENGVLFVNETRVIKSSVVTANTMLVGDFDYADGYQGDELTIEIGEVDTQFKKGEVTMLATEQLALLVRSTYEDAFIKVTSISAAKTAITA